MSDKQKWPQAAAIEAAADILIRLEDACQPEMCVIAGSIRRGKPNVGDIEILLLMRCMRQYFKNNSNHFSSFY